MADQEQSLLQQLTEITRVMQEGQLVEGMTPEKKSQDTWEGQDCKFTCPPLSGRSDSSRFSFQTVTRSRSNKLNRNSKFPPVGASLCIFTTQYLEFDTFQPEQPTHSVSCELLSSSEQWPDVFCTSQLQTHDVSLTPPR